MNTLFMRYPTNTNVYYGLLLAILVLSLVLCADLIGHAILSDGVALGDPYYQDTILANDRAPIALWCTWLIVGLSGIAALVRPNNR